MVGGTDHADLTGHAVFMYLEVCRSLLASTCAHVGMYKLFLLPQHTEDYTEGLHRHLIMVSIWSYEYSHEFLFKLKTEREFRYLIIYLSFSCTSRLKYKRLLSVILN